MRPWIRSHGLLLALAVGAALTPLRAALGQDEAQPSVETGIPGLPIETAPAVEPPPMTGIESIAVIGERMETDVMDEAEAVTRFGMADLDKLSISNVDGLAANVPGLHVGQQGQAAIVTLRGIGTENASITGESGVSFHVDGISYARPTAARVAFYDIRLIDVKRGPQGLVGGKNSTSGSINVETNDPSQEYEVNGDVLFGNYDRVRSRGHINIPLGEIAAFRTAVFYENRDGYLDNKTVGNSGDPFDADNFGFRSKLRLMPSETLDLVLSYNYFDEAGNGPQADIVPVYPTVACRRPFQSRRTALPLQLGCATFKPNKNSPEVLRPAVEDLDPRETYADYLATQDDLYWGTHGHLTWDAPSIPLLGETRLDMRGGYQRTDTTYNWDFDTTSLTRFPLDQESLSHEYVADARWSGTGFDDALEWQTSLFFTRERATALTVTPDLGSVSESGQVSGSEAKIETNQAVTNKSYGAALHGSYQLTDSVKFKLGGRWVKDRKHSLLSRITGGTQEACVGGRFGTIGTDAQGKQIFPVVPECALTDRGTAWGSALEWRPTDNHLLYVGIDRGFKSGGFGLGGVGSYGSEQIWAYAAGTKSTFFDERLQINLEGFFYNYDDMQIALVDGTQTRTENADTRMYGAELEANIQPIEGLRLGIVAGVLKTELIEFFSLDPATLNNTFLTNLLTQRAEAERDGKVYANQLCVDPATRDNVPCGTFGDKDGLFDYSGNVLSRAPEWKLTLSAEYEIPLGRFGSLTPRVHYAWQDDTYFRVYNRDFDLQEAYHKTDLKLLWDSPEQRWTAELFVENVEDAAIKDYILIGSRVFNSPPLAWYSAPRFYGARLGFKF